MWALMTTGRILTRSQQLRVYNRMLRLRSHVWIKVYAREKLDWQIAHGQWF